MTEFEAKTLKEIELIKAKTAVTVSVFNSLTVSASALSDSQIATLFKVLKRAQESID